MENLDLGLNLGFGENSSIDTLLEKVNTLEKSITNINEVSNIDMFTNALRNFQELKTELKEIKGIVNGSGGDNKSTGDTSNGKNPYKNETFNLSQTLKNIEKLLNDINTTNKTTSHENKVKGGSGKSRGSINLTEKDELIMRANAQLRNFYNDNEKTYKYKKGMSTDSISKMTEEQYSLGFKKIVKGMSKDVVDILDKDLLKKMVDKNATEMLKNRSYSSKKELDDRYKEISNLVKMAGFNPNMMKNNSSMKKEYNNRLNKIENDSKAIYLKRTEQRLQSKGITRSSNTDNMTGKQIEQLISENRKLFNIVNSSMFKNYGKDNEFKTTEQKLNSFMSHLNDNKIKGQNIKENGLSFQNTMQQNSGTIIAGLEAFRYLGVVTNFITSKDFERNMGALGIVGNLGNQASHKNRIIRESNEVGADINEFAEGVREVIKTGKTYEQSMNLVKVAGKVAVASFEDLTTATNILNSRFTALGLNATDKNLNEFANRLQSALDNTALDLQDVNNAGKQTNTAMNAIINSAEEKGIQGRSVEKYTMDVSNLELALLSSLKQQGKTGEQSGIVLRTLFTKLMSVDGQGKKMLNNDLKKMSKEEREQVGFGSVEEMTDLVLGGELEKVIEGLSKLQEQGNLSYSTIKKIFTERHSSAISTLFTEVNGDVDKFVDKITTGIDVAKNFAKAMENWAVKFDRIFKNFKSITTNTFSRGIFGGVLGTGVGIVDKLTDLTVKGQSSNNILVSSFSQAVPQSLTQAFAFKNLNEFTQGKAYQKVESAYDLTLERIKNDPTLKDDLVKKNEILSKIEMTKNKDLETLINGKGMKGFSNQVKGATANVYELSSKIKDTATGVGEFAKQGIENFSALSNGAKGLGMSIAAALKPMLILTAINLTINALIGLYEKAQKLKNDADNLDKEIANLGNVGKNIEKLENDINTIFDFKNLGNQENNAYISNINKMIQANEQLKASIENINAIKNNPFKDIDTIRNEIWKEKTNNSLENKKDMGVSGRVGINNNKGDSRLSYEMTYGNVPRLALWELGDEYSRNYAVKYRGENFKDLKVLDKENRDRISKLGKTQRSKELFSIEYAYYKNKYINSTDKAINNIYDDVLAKYKKTLKDKGIDEKSFSEEDKQKYLVSNMRISNELVSNVFGKESAEALKGKDVANTKEFYTLLNSLGGKDLQDNIRIFNELIASGQIEPETLSLLTRYSEYQLNTIEEANEIFYKQLERNKESFEQSKAMLDGYKNQLTAMYSKTGLPNIAYGKILNEEKDFKTGKLKTLTQTELDKYNTAYNNDINSIPKEMFMNNMEGVQEYQASMSVYYQKRATLEKQIQDTQEELNKANQEGNTQEQENLKKKLDWINNDIKTLDQSKDMAKKVLHFSNFTARKYDELLSMSTELIKAQSVYNNMVGTSFGNQGSQLQTAFDSLNASRNLFNKVGKMNFNNQISSAYIEDKGGEKLRKITGKTDYSQVNINDYDKVMAKLDYFRKNNINEENGISVETLQEQATMYSSIIAEKIQIQQQEIQLAQQQKQLQIDIVKYWLKENELKANFVENPDRHINNFLLSNVDTVRKTQSGDSGLFKMNDLQTITNLKLDSSNMKMGEQLDFARRQIMVAKENAQRQINAIRRLEQRNTTNSNKSDMLNKSNTISTNNTLSTGINTLSENLNNMFDELSSVLNSALSSTMGGSTGSPIAGIPSGYNPNADRWTKYWQVYNLAQANGDPHPMVTASQWALESGWGKKQSGKNNLFGVKGKTGTRKMGYEGSMATFRDYATVEESIKDHLNVKMNGSAFKNLGYVNASTDEEALRRIASMYVDGTKTAGTFTNDYIKSLTSIMNEARKQGKVNSSFSNKFTLGNDTNPVISGANGLRTKNLKENTGGGKITQSTYDFAKLVQANIKGFERFTAFNDLYHKNNSPNSLHTKGIKFDFTVSGDSSKVVQQLYDLAKAHGFDIKVIDEYKNPSSKATGGHLDVQVNGRGNGNFYGGLISYRKPNLKMMGTTSENVNMQGGYIPNISNDLQKEIQKIYDNDFNKSMVKTEVEAKAIEEMMENIKLWSDLPIPLFQKRLQEFVDDKTSVTTEDLSIFKDLARSIMDSFQTNLEISKEAYEKMLNQFLEDMNNLHFAFEEINTKIKTTAVDWHRAFSVVTTSDIGDSLLQSFNQIIETNDKINSKFKKMVMDIKLSPSLISTLNYLNDTTNLNLNTDKQRFEYLTDNGRMTDTLRYLEDKMFDLAKDQFNSLGLDKLTLQNMSDVERNDYLSQVYTELSRQGQTSADMFRVSQDYNNNLTMYKLLGQRIEENIEVKKQETEIMRTFNRTITDFVSKIKNMSNTMFNMETTRNLRTAISDLELHRRNIDPNSKYGKKQAELVKIENNKNYLSELQQQIKTMLMTDKNARKVLEARRYTDEDINNMDITDIDKLIEVSKEVNSFALIQNEQLKKTFNKFIEENDLVEYFRNLDITNVKSIQENKKMLLNNSDVIDKVKLNEAIKILDTFENNAQKTEELSTVLIKAINVTKDLKESFTENIKYFSDKSIDLLSSMLFGTDFEWKGFDYKESLKYLTDLGINDRDKIISSVDKFLEKHGIDIIKTKEKEPRKLRSLEEDEVKNPSETLGGDIRGAYINNLKNTDILDKGKLNTLFDSDGNILKAELVSLDKSTVNELKDTLFNVGIDSEGYAPYLQGQRIISVKGIQTEKGIDLVPVGTKDETPLLSASNSNELIEKLKEHNKKEWLENNLDKKDFNSVISYSFVDSIYKENRDLKDIDNAKIYKFDLIDDTNLDNVSQRIIAESEINLRKNEEKLQEIKSENVKTKETLKNELDFGVQLYKDLGTKNINLDKDSKNYFPYKIDDRNGIVYRIDKAEEVIETTTRIPEVYYNRDGNKMHLMVDGEKQTSLGLEQTKKTANIYKYNEDGSKELIKGKIKLKNINKEFGKILDDFAEEASQPRITTKTGTYFEQTPVFNMYTRKFIDGETLKYTNWDTYDNAINYASQQNHNAINDERMNKYIMREYSKLSREEFDKLGTINRNFEQYNDSLIKSNETENKVNNIINPVKGETKIFGDEAIRSKIDINSINTKSTDFSDMPNFVGKGLKGNEQFFKYMSDKTGIPVEWLIAEAYSESSIDPNSVDKYYDKKKKKWVENRYKGLYQVGSDYWTPEKAKQVSEHFGVEINKDFNKGWKDPKQNSLMVLYRMLESVESRRKQGLKDLSFANIYSSHMLPAYANNMDIKDDNTKLIDVNKAIKQKHMINNKPLLYTSGMDTTNGEVKQNMINRGLSKLRESGFFNSSLIENVNSGIQNDKIISLGNDVLVSYDNAIYQGILEINDKYLSASAGISDYGDPVVRQFAKDTVGIKEKQNYQERNNTYKGKKFKGYYEGYDDPEYVLDIGHFAGESNAYTENGIGEYEFNREIIKKLAKEFDARGIKYGILEREKGSKKIDIDFVNENFKGVKLVELHNNASKDKSSNGIEFLVSNQKSDNDFGFTMLEELNKFTGMKLRGNKGQSPIINGNGKQFVEGLTNLDNILVELGFLSNPKEVEKMLSNNSHDVILGLLNGFLKSSGKEAVNELLTISKDGIEKKEQQPKIEVVYTNGNNNKDIKDISKNYQAYSDEYNKNLLEAQHQNIHQNNNTNLTEQEEKKLADEKKLKKFMIASNLVVVIDGILKKELNYKKKQLEIQQKVLEMNLQMAETTEERRRIEEQILQNKLAQVDNEYNTQSSFMGGMIKGTAGFGLQGALSGAMQGSSFGVVGSIVGAGLGLVGGLLGGTGAKIQAEQQKSLQISQQKLQWLAEDRNKYLKTMANAMSEQAKWTTKIGVNDAISRSVRFALSRTDLLGGTASDTKTIQNKKKKGGGLLGSKKYDTVKSFTASYNTNDPMFGGRVFDDRTDLDFAYGVLTRKILGDKVYNKSGNQSLLQGILLNSKLPNIVKNGLLLNNSSKKIDIRSIFKSDRTHTKIVNGKYTFKNGGKFGFTSDNNINDVNNSVVDNYTGSLAEYLDKKISTSGLELTSGQFLNAFWGRDTLKNMGMLQDTSRDWEISSLVNSMKAQYSKMGASQEKVDMLALINFYENIQALLDKEGKTTKRLFGNYYGIETEEVKDEKGNVTEYRRVSESMWSDLYQQQFQNIMNGTNNYDIGTKFIQGTLNAFIQNVSSGRNTVKAITDEFNRLADEIYNVVTRTGEFSNVSASIKGLIDNMATLKRQQRETENFTIELAKKWVSLGGNITDIVKDMNNGLSLTIENIKSTMLGDSLENTINNFGSSLFQKLGESMTTNLVNQKYANSIFNMNSLLTNATDTNSISDIVALANGYKGMSVQIESDRERLSAIERLFTANRDIDYVDESIQYETGTSQSVTNNYTFTTDINAGTIVADELSKEILAQNLFAPLVQMLKDSGFIH